MNKEVEALLPIKGMLSVTKRPVRASRTRLPAGMFACLAVLLVLPPLAAWSADDHTAEAKALASIRIEDLRRHVDYLASDDLEGREAGTVGGHTAGDYLRDELKRLHVTPGNGDGQYFQEFGYQYRNVIGKIEGRDPKLKNEYILIGAHYDHIGYGTSQNSRGPVGYIHNGADDNASGTAGLLEVAEALATSHRSPRRSLLIVFWDAEEKGLLGSEHWVSEPTCDLQSVKLVINADMIGRLRQDTLQVFGTRTAAGLRRLVCDHNQSTRLNLSFLWRMKREGDHYTFYEHMLPSLMLHTGKHDDYHRPSDDADKLNLAGMQRIARLMLGIVLDAVNREAIAPFRRPDVWYETPEMQERIETPLPQPAPRLGITFDTEHRSGTPIEVVAVEPNSPAAWGGLRVADRILQFGGYKTSLIDDFRGLTLGAKSPVSVVVHRNGSKEPVNLTVELSGTPTRVGLSWREDSAEPNCVVLNQVVVGSPANHAGLEANDRVYSVSGHTFGSSDEFYRLVTTLNSPLDLTVERNGIVRNHRINLLPPPPQTGPPRHTTQSNKKSPS